MFIATRKRFTPEDRKRLVFASIWLAVAIALTVFSECSHWYRHSKYVIAASTSR